MDLSDHENHHDAYVRTGRFLEEAYMLKRSHSSPGCLTPIEFEAQWRSHQAPAENVV